MKKVLIIGGIVVVLLLSSLGAWAYLLYTGTTAEDVGMPMEGNPFAEGSFRTDTFEPEVSPVPTLTGSGDQTLRQLSLRKTIGAVLIPSDSGTVVRYAEAGTGHLFEVPLQGGTEMRISNMTFPQAKDAVWSLQGTRVVVVRQNAETAEAFLGAIEKADDGTMTLSGAILPPQAHSFGFNASGDQFYYAVRTESGTTGFRRDLKSGKETVMFEVPLREVTVAWDPSPLIVTKASVQLLGYAYRSDMTRIGEPTLGLRALGDARGYALGGIEGSALTGTVIGTSTVPLDRGIAPDKCALTSTQLVCGLPKDLNIAEFPDAWYRGEVSYDDSIYAFNRTTGVSTLLSDPSTEARREIDIARFEKSGSDGQLVFTSKVDRTLWLLTL